MLPPGAATVLPLVSAKIFGQPLCEAVAHRPERVAAVTGAEPGEPLTPEHVARLLTSEHGALRGVGRATVVPIINMVDDQAKRAAAREAARRRSREVRSVAAGRARPHGRGRPRDRGGRPLTRHATVTELLQEALLIVE